MNDFEKFFKEMQNTLYRIVKNYIYSDETSKDIVSECMLIIYKKWNHIKNLDNKEGYAVRTAINLSKKYLLKNKIKKIFSIDNDENDYEIESNNLNPYEKYILNEENLWIESQLNKLKEIEKNIIILKDIDNKKFEEISKLLNKKLPTVKSIYRRAKIKILNNYERELNYEKSRMQEYSKYN